MNFFDAKPSQDALSFARRVFVRPYLRAHFFIAWVVLTGLFFSSCDDSSSTRASDIVDAVDVDASLTVDTDAAEATDAADQEITFARAVIPEVLWVEHERHLIGDDGRSDEIEVSYPANQRYIALRITPNDVPPAAAAALCYDLSPVSLASGESLVAAPDADCPECTEQLSPGSGSGVFVFSTTAIGLDAANTLRFQVTLTDCDLGIRASRARFPDMPASVRVDVAWEAHPADDTARATLGVRVAINADSLFAGVESLEEDPRFAATWRVAQERFDAVGIDLVFESSANLTQGGEVVFGPGDSDAPNALQTELLALLTRGEDDTRFVPVVMTPCLEWRQQGNVERPIAYTTRIPGALSAEVSPSLILISDRGCLDPDLSVETWDSDRAGLVLAHELGHYLGLYHSDEASGAHLLVGAEEQLMGRWIAVNVDEAQAWFSAEQAAVMRRHPDVFFER